MMIEFFHIAFLKFTFIDLIDILIVSFFIYKLLTLMRGTKSLQILMGLLFLFLTAFIAFWFQFEALKWLITNISTVGIIVLVIVFQPELRRALMQMGQNRMFRKLFKTESRNILDEVCRAAEQLSARKWGALICFERSVGLNHVIETGKKLGAEISSEVIVTIFAPHTPLHDGAIIIQANYIAAAGCTLPLTQNPVFHQSYGTRHKAAVGLSEESDSVVIVISEETGRISVAYDGILNRGIEIGMLSTSLRKILGAPKKI
ncbi:MAG: TIGR00159 family protein [candidate division Zixibacteria bacterium CG_4_9_14_3_um_filter_46_8]|nr:MAG: TIGR00159 family protein [candidate division Zixibacteria bacterium CG_4_9_14_3_um_filter_46_8]